MEKVKIEKKTNGRHVHFRKRDTTDMHASQTRDPWCTHVWQGGWLPVSGAGLTWFDGVFAWIEDDGTV
jgi:hypothetical protein